MNKKKYFNTIIIILVYQFFSSVIYPESNAESVNISAATETLKKTSNFINNEKWDEALFETQIGQIYDPKIADFFYLEALCKSKLDYPNIEILQNIQKAFSQNMKWSFFDKNDGIILYAQTNYKIKKYAEALKLIESLEFPSSESDLIKAASLYGLSQDEKAKKIIDNSLSKWALDSKFAKLFFLQEKGKKITKSGKKLSKKILSKLHTWQEEDPSLLILASPFEEKSEENIRRLKLYRNSYLNLKSSTNFEQLYYHSYEILLCLRYGIIDEHTAVKEFLNLTSYYKNPINHEKILIQTTYEPHLIELLKLIGNNKLRSEIKETLDSYHGLIITDENNDLIINSKIYYQNGRPSYGEFDYNQTGIPQYIVKFDFGIPTNIFGKDFQILYDQYPATKKIKINNKSYNMRAMEFKWEPIILKKINLNLYQKNKQFFTFKINKKEKKLKSNQIISYAISSEENDKNIENGVKQIFYENGIPIISEIKINNELYSKTKYKNGIPVLTNIDKDGDNYFETKIEYNSKNSLKIISIDINKNKFYEYKESFFTNSILKPINIKTWDTNEDGKIEIIHTQYSNGNAKTEWLHPTQKKMISIIFLNGEPKKLINGNKKIKILKMKNFPVYWLKLTPKVPEKINKKIIEIFNQTSLPVVSYMFEINKKEIYAIRSGGFIFAEIINEK